MSDLAERHLLRACLGKAKKGKLGGGPNQTTVLLVLLLVVQFIIHVALEKTNTEYSTKLAEGKEQEKILC